MTTTTNWTERFEASDLRVGDLLMWLAEPVGVTAVEDDPLGNVFVRLEGHRNDIRLRHNTDVEILHVEEG